MKIITPEKRKGHNYLTCCIFGVSGQGKTSCVTALPREGDTWVAPDGSPGKFIYVAADKTSPSLASVHPDDRDRAIVVIPDGNVKVDSVHELAAGLAPRVNDNQPDGA